MIGVNWTASDLICPESGRSGWLVVYKQRDVGEKALVCVGLTKCRDNTSNAKSDVNTN